MSWRNRKDKEEDEKDRMNNFPFDIFGNDFFNNFYKKMMDEFEDIMNFENDQNDPNQTVKKFGPYYYSRITSVGPDGNPQVKEYGNFNPFGNQMPTISETPIEQITDTPQKDDTLIDAFVENDKVRIIAEIPGVEKENIDVKAMESKVILKAHNNSKDYCAEKELSVKIKPETAKANYRNGILEVIFERKDPGEYDKEYSVKIE
ncbi:MAG: Hsp20/alpha crystallin family protein [Asgard group archaeon]|nr:Hsp20/alpha crystallin family protein [Asgard group archaeon]